MSCTRDLIIDLCTTNSTNRNALDYIIALFINNYYIGGTNDVTRAIYLLYTVFFYLKKDEKEMI